MFDMPHTSYHPTRIFNELSCRGDKTFAPWSPRRVFCPRHGLLTPNQRGLRHLLISLKRTAQHPLQACSPLGIKVGRKHRHKRIALRLFSHHCTSFMSFHDNHFLLFALSLM